MFCTRCATFNPSDTARCGGCGARLDWPDRRVSPRSGAGRRTLIFLLPLAVAMGVITLVGWRTWEVRQTQSAAYERALDALTTGNLPAAIAQFGEAGGYRDAREQRITTQQLLAPYQAALLDAQLALDHGEHKRAVELLRSVVAAMPENDHAAGLLAVAEDGFRSDLEREIAVALSNRDWLRAERTMLTLAQFTGELPDPEALDELRLTHAPLLYTRDGTLYRIGPDGGDETVLLDEVPVAAPIWSPDRSRIAFFSAIPGAERVAALFVVDADGSNLHLVDEGAIPSLPAWRGDGRQLAYVRPATKDGVGYATTVSLFDLEGGTSRDVPVPDGLSRIISPSWASDGTRLAAVGIGVGGANDVLVIDAVTLEAERLLDAPPAHARSVSWSSSSDTLLLWSTMHDSDWYAFRGSSVFLISIEDRSVFRVTTTTQSPSRPIWAPDGVRFAYLDRGATMHVRVRTGIGDRAIELPHRGNGILSWGPGGLAISVPALDPAKPVMFVSVGDRLGPVRLLPLNFEDGWPAVDIHWAPYTEPDPVLYEPFPEVRSPGGE